MVIPYKTPYGEGVSIKDTDGLHRLIGEQIVAMPKKMTGAEFRFLRLQLDMSQRHLAAAIGADEQAIHAGKRRAPKMSMAQADRLLRLIYSEYVGGNVKIQEAVDRLAELNKEIENTTIRLREDHEHWSAAA